MNNVKKHNENETRSLTIVSHESALKLYRSIRLKKMSLSYINDKRFKDVVYSDEELVARFEEILGEKISVFNRVDTIEQNVVNRHVTKYKKRHSVKIPISAVDVVKIGKPASSFKRGLIIVSPEHLLCQLAFVYDFVDLFLIASEFCSTYCLNPNSKKGFIDTLRPLTTFHKLKKYILNFNTRYRSFNTNIKQISFKGYRNLSLVLTFLKDNTASPAESRLHLVLSGPRRFGCYNISNLDCNQKIKLNDNLQMILKKNFVVADFLHLKNHVVVEYDSATYHSGSENYILDTLRANSLQKIGYSVYSITPKIFYNSYLINKTALQIRKRCGQYAYIRSDNFLFRQQIMLARLRA